MLLVVTSAATVAMLSDRLQLALSVESSALLAADLVVQNRTGLRQPLLREAQQRGLRTATVLGFTSMLFGPEAASIAGVRAVDSGYPLRGQVEVGTEVFERGIKRVGGPPTGEIWLESRLFAALGIEVGSTLEVGELELRASAVLVREPDPTQGSGFAPHALMHLSDLDATGVVQPGSRVQYRHLFAGTADQIAAFDDWLRGDEEVRLQEDDRVLRVGDNQPSLARALRRGESFMLMAVILILLGCAGAVSLSARRYAEQRIELVGLLKAMGLTPLQVGWLIGWQLCLLALTALSVGLALGWGLQYLLGNIVAMALEIDLPGTGWTALLVVLVALLTLMSFALPPLLALLRLPPVVALRRLGLVVARYLALIPPSIVLLVLALMGLYTGQWQIIAVVAGTVVLVLGLSVLLVYWVSRLLQRGGRRLGGWWRLLTASLTRPGAQQPLQLAVIALVVMTGLQLGVMRLNLLDEWQARLPDDAHNQFLVNISSAQIEAVTARLQALGWDPAEPSPILSARWLRINGGSLGGNTPAGEPVATDVTLSWTEQLPYENRLVAGDWWDRAPVSGPMVSVERSSPSATNSRLAIAWGFVSASEPWS